MIPAIWLHGTAVCGLPWSERIGGTWPDLPGHGQAPRARAARVDAYAEALIPDLPDRFVIGGHSLGGMVAMQIAARLPERCAGLVLVDAPLRLPGWLLRGLGHRLSPAIVRVPGPGGLAPIVARMSSNRALRPALRSVIAATPPKGLMDAMRAALRFDGRPLVGQLTMPVLSLIGTSSILTGAADRAAFDNVKLFETGHMLPFDLPDAVADEILTFLEGLT